MVSSHDLLLKGYQKMSQMDEDIDAKPVLSGEAKSRGPEVQNAEDASKRLVKEHLECLASTLIDAINARNFEPTSFPWNQIADHFTTGTGTGARPYATNKLQMLEGHRKLAEANSNFEIRILSYTTSVSEKIGTAQVVMNAASTGVPGVPVGLWRNAVTILDFRLFNGRWLGVRESTISGAGRMDEDWL